ncbi:glycosyltransferase [Pseudomonas umsongensis]|uniref:glycosyltransferase n=1 Tax=Pseudomonas umsongensis TaxID=198618 RepID=UPI003ED0E2AC
MKVLFLITSLDVGGAERQVLDLAERFVFGGHRVLIVYLTGSGSLVPSNYLVDVTCLNSTKSLVGFFQTFFSLRALIRDFRPDVVHSHMVHANLLARLVRLVTNIPRLVCTAHSNNEGGRLRMFAYRITNFLADVTTNVSRSAVEAFESKGAIKHGEMLAVPNGINTDRFSFNQVSRSNIRDSEGVTEGEKVILAVGRLVEAKDYPNLLRAFDILCRHDHTITLWIIGDGDLKTQLVEMCEKLKLSSRVKFFGIREDVADFYSCADVYVLSSAWEGFGLVVAEAMATERVIVATDSGGVKEVVGDKGIVVQPGNPEELAAAIRHALDLDSNAARTLGRLARERVVDNYSLDSVVMTWMKLYRPR